MNKLDIKPFFTYGNRLEREHLKIFNSNKFHISISQFISEVIAGVEKYFRENKNHTLFLEWYKKIIIFGGFTSPMIKLTCVKNNKIIYENIHKVISILDENPNISYYDFANDINSKLIKIYNEQGT
jgi:hypothetical protein